MIINCQIAAIMNAINYPKVVSRKDGKVYLDISVRGKGMRLFNGRRFGIDLQPNSFPLPQRVNQAHILAAQVYAKLLAGELPLLNAGQGVVVSCRSDLYYLREALRLKLREGHSKHYTNALKLAFELINNCSKAEEVSVATIECALSSYSNPTSFNTLRRNMNILCRFAVRLGMRENPVARIPRKKEKAVLNKPLDHLPQLFEEIRSFNSNLFLCCLLTYGCLLRPHREVRELTWGDFSEDLSYISLSGNRNKSGRNRIVPVPSYVRSILKRKERHLNIFSGSSDPFNPDYFKSLRSRFKKRSKILQPEQTLYSFRHTGAIDVYKRTGSIEKLKTVMGHSSIVVSLTYLRGLNVTELNEQDMPNLGPPC